MTTDLEFVRGELNKLRPIEWKAIAKKKRIGLRTIRRIARSEIKSHRSDIIEKLAIHFKRAQ